MKPDKAEIAVRSVAGHPLIEAGATLFPEEAPIDSVPEVMEPTRP